MFKTYTEHENFPSKWKMAKMVPTQYKGYTFIENLQNNFFAANFSHNS